MHSEKELIKELNSYQTFLEALQRQALRLPGSIEIELQAAALKDQIQVVKKNLRDSADKSVTSLKRKALLTILPMIKSALNPRDMNYSISRKQNTSCHNYIYGRIIFDIANAFEHGEFSPSDPKYLYELEQTVDTASLQHLLQTQYDILLLGNYNYVSLKDFVDGIKAEILALSRK